MRESARVAIRVPGKSLGTFVRHMMRCTSRFMATASLWVWLAAISRRSGFLAQQEGREAAAHQFALAVLRGHEDHQPAAIAVATRSSISARASWCQCGR